MMVSTVVGRGVAQISLALAITLIAAIETASAEPSPSSAAISPDEPSVTWTGGEISGMTAPGGIGVGSACVEDVNCETFTLTVRAGDYTESQLRITLNWPIQGDYDLFVYDENGEEVAKSEIPELRTETTAIPSSLASSPSACSQSS